MAYDTLQTEIRQYIQTNGQQEITGQILQNVLLDMVNAYPSLDGYATQQWVQNQNYLTSAELSGYATETWVQNQLGLYLPLTGGTLTGDLNMAYSSKLNFGTSYIYQSTIPGPQGTNMGHILNFYGVDGNGYYDFDNSVHATSFVKSGGTSAQFLKADGSVDSNTYMTSAAISDMATQTWVGQQGFLTSVPSGYATETWVGNNYLPLTGGTLTGDLNMAYSSKLNFGTSYIYQSTIPGPQGTNMGHILNFYGVDGNGYYDFDNSVHATSFIQTSDIRRKNIISDIGMTIDDITKAPLFKFTWKDGKDGNVHIGTSAQYWQGLMPELTSENKNGVLGLHYDVAALAGVITVAKRVVDHEARIAELEKENALLKEKLNIN